MQRELGETPKVRLELRHGGREIGANAFALPAGIGCALIADPLVAAIAASSRLPRAVVETIGAL